jgi:hypothetical protein
LKWKILNECGLLVMGFSHLPPKLWICHKRYWDLQYVLVSCLLLIWWLLSPRVGTKIAQTKRFKIALRHTDMTIHWKSLEEHFLMVPTTISFQFNHFRGNNEFSGFFSKNLRP